MTDDKIQNSAFNDPDPIDSIAKSTESRVLPSKIPEQF